MGYTKRLSSKVIPFSSSGTSRIWKSRVEVYERDGKSIISEFKRAFIDLIKKFGKNTPYPFFNGRYTNGIAVLSSFSPTPKGNAKTTASCQTNMTPRHKIKRYELWNTVRLTSFKVLKSTIFFQLGVSSHCHHHHPYQSITVLALIGYFEVTSLTWHLTVKLFPAKISEQATLQKIWRQRITVHCCLRILTDDFRYNERVNEIPASKLPSYIKKISTSPRETKWTVTLRTSH